MVRLRSMLRRTLILTEAFVKVEMHQAPTCCPQLKLVMQEELLGRG